jgi:alpha-tubulin suppressor-like RCC1 family protein
MLVVLADGRLLAWGADNRGQLGRGTERRDMQPQAAQVVPGSYQSVAAGHGWSAALDTDGRLWTWGNNYMASLGDGGTKLRTQPVAIGEVFVQLRAEERWGLALKRDGSLWTWGGRVATRNPANGSETWVTTPWTLGNGFAQIELGPRGELQALTRDGELWTWRGFSGGESLPQDEPRKLGGGFTRLAGHHMQAAYKADGTLWAWGETLAAMADVGGDRKRPPQAVGRGFAQAVYAPDGVVAALKEDGSVWLTRSRGRVTQLESVGCGYQRVALVGSTWERQPKHLRVVALRDDGHLVAWTYTSQGAEPGEPAPAAPWDLGAGWQQLEMTDGQWGNRGTELLLADRDGNLWQSRAPDKKDKPWDWLQKVQR